MYSLRARKNIYSLNVSNKNTWFINQTGTCSHKEVCSLHVFFFSTSSVEALQWVLRTLSSHISPALCYNCHMTWYTMRTRNLWLAVCCNPSNCSTRWRSPKYALSPSATALVTAVFLARAALSANVSGCLRGKPDYRLQCCQNRDNSSNLGCSFSREKPDIFPEAVWVRILALGLLARQSFASEGGALHSELSAWWSGILGITQASFSHHVDL